MSKDRIEVLLVPRIQFVRAGRHKTVTKMRRELEELMPSNDTLYQYFCNGRIWDEYKQTIVTEVAKRKAVPLTTRMDDVPLTIKLESLHSNTGPTTW